MLFLLLLALVAGSFLPIQAGVNAHLKLYAGHPVIAAFISFAVGTLALLVSSLAMRLPWPSLAAFSDAPWWVWIGGVLGAVYVFLAVVLANRLGAAVLIAFIVAGQMIASIIVDHYGLVGFPRHPVNAWRIIGAVLLLSGVVLIRYE
jgi:transporter family-2 protein